MVTGFFSFPHHRQFVDIVCNANLFSGVMHTMDWQRCPWGVGRNCIPADGQAGHNIRSIESDLQA
jgi:hypothetical protein